jgi:hypothetical protein
VRRPPDPGAEGFLGDEDGGGSTGALFDRLAGVRSNLARERDAAPFLWLELSRTAADRRRERIVEDRRFQTFGLCELLLAKAAAASATAGDHADHATDAGGLAALALAAAERLDTGIHAPTVAHDLKARAWAELGEARRVLRDLTGAEEALAAAAACLSQGTGDLLVDARLLEFEAAVRADQGRVSEAAALLRQAAARYAQVNEPELEARANARRDALRRAPRSLPGGHPAFGTNS